MTYVLGRVSNEKLIDVHPDLARVVRRAIEITGQDFSVAEGLRSQAQANANAASGTGIKNSRHLRQPDGYSHAVDLWPAPLNWKNLDAFRLVAHAMLQAADEIDVPLQWGADWDTDGIEGERGEFDMPHFQTPLPRNIQRSRDARIRRMGERAAGEELVL